jgi:hypothetical protein
VCQTKEVFPNPPDYIDTQNEKPRMGITCSSVVGHTDDPAEEGTLDIPENVLPAGGDVIGRDDHRNHSSHAEVVHTFDGVGMRRSHGAEDRGEGADAYLDASEVASYAFRDQDACVRKDLPPLAVVSWLPRLRLLRHLSRQDSFRCAYQPRARSIVSPRKKVAVK